MPGTKTISIIDECRQVLASGRVSQRGGRFVGHLELGRMPATVLNKFERYEQVVEGQMFSLLDEVEAEISGMPLKVILDEGPDLEVNDLQIYPSTGNVAFSLAKRPRRSAPVCRK